MYTRTRRNSNTLARRSTELALAVPQVVAHRVARMAMAGPVLSARDREEFGRMVSEKNAAFSESCIAMARRSLQANQQFAQQCMRSFWQPWLSATPSAQAAQWQGAALAVLSSGLAPVHRTAMANAKRLSHTGLR